MNNELSAKAEAILMGMTQDVASEDEAVFLIDYILKTVMPHQDLDAGKILRKALHYSPDKTIAFIGVSRLMGMFNVLNIVLKGKKSKSCKITSQNGVLAYCYNMDEPEFSELGYMFFEQTPKGISRVA